MAEHYLSNEVTDHTAIIKAHSRSISVEDSSNPHLHNIYVRLSSYFGVQYVPYIRKTKM